MKKYVLIAALFSGLQAWAGIPGWQEIKPGGNTLCAKGAPFSFFVHRGDPQKVAVSFAGGGACWDGLSCQIDRVYTDEVGKTLGQISGQAGIFDFNDKNNPYKDWTHVFVPYCTGDVHMGNGDATYTRDNGSTYTIHHRGAVNAQAALSWVMSNYKVVNDLSVNGCSAGSYASIMWLPTLAENYKTARIQQFGDSGAGVIDSLFFPQWNLQDSMPRWIPGLDPAQRDTTKLNIVDVYSSIAQYYPQARFSQFNHIRDRVQIFYYSALGGVGIDWTSRMFKNMEATAVAAPNFRYFVAPGYNHCSMTNSRFYSTQSEGVNLGKWLSEQVSGRNVENVKCQGCGF